MCAQSSFKSKASYQFTPSDRNVNRTAKTLKTSWFWECKSPLGDFRGMVKLVSTFDLKSNGASHADSTSATATILMNFN